MHKEADSTVSDGKMIRPHCKKTVAFKRSGMNVPAKHTGEPSIQE